MTAESCSLNMTARTCCIAGKSGALRIKLHGGILYASVKPVHPMFNLRSGQGLVQRSFLNRFFFSNLLLIYASLCDPRTTPPQNFSAPCALVYQFEKSCQNLQGPESCKELLLLPLLHINESFAYDRRCWEKPEALPEASCDQT